MGDENACPGHHLQRRHRQEAFAAGEQRARITGSFRAAKPLLACKRPREFAPVHSPRNGGTVWMKPPPHASPIVRVPLTELQTNSLSPVPTRNAPAGVEAGLGCEGELVASLEQQGDVHSFVDPLSPTRMLNDELDEDVLKEIDAICEQRSSAKRERLCSVGICSSVVGISLTCGEMYPEEGNGSEHWRVQQSERERVNVPQHENGDSPSSVGASHVTLASGELFSENRKSVKQSEEERLNVAQDVVGTDDGSVPEEYLGYLQSLNERQREAACSDISVPLMIVAGPGSGKTSTMVGRVLTLIKEGISPSNILAMTFTTAATAEMRDRIAKVTGKAIAKEIAINTFHSFCLQLCRSHAEKLQRTSEFLIYGHGQQRRAVIEALRLLENQKDQTSGKSSRSINTESFKEKSKRWQKFVTQAKAAGRTPEVCQKMGDEIGGAVLHNYENILRSCNALDYHDFISCSVKLLTEFPEVHKDCQDSWKAIVVDEFQDTSSMQYGLLRVLASHNRLTIIGDEDQSIFSFNGADVCGFDSFRRDFPAYKEVRLCKNYRSTRCIVEAASFLIRNNVKRCQQKEVVTENSSGHRITIKECYTEDAQCAFVTDKILELTSDGTFSKCSFNSMAILYRRQVTGRAFQMSFRDRRIPFNNHGVAFYRKKVIKSILAILRTTLPGCGDGPFRQAFKALFSAEKEGKKKIIDHIEKISSVRNCSFISAACDIFGAKISGTFKRAQLTQGRKVLSTLDMLSKLVGREQSISSVISSAVNVLPQKHIFEQRAVVDADGGKYLNEDHDLRSVLQYLLDDVAGFLSVHFRKGEADKVIAAEENGCQNMLSAFLDHISLRETEHFRSLRSENENSVTLTTIHQSKGLEWDTVFVVKANESEIPLLHEYKGLSEEMGTTLEEERRLLYVAMTRARKKLYILYVLMDSNMQLLQPSRFLREIPVHLLDFQVHANETKLHVLHGKHLEDDVEPALDHSKCEPCPEVVHNPSLCIRGTEETSCNSTESAEACFGNNFLKRFNVEDRSTVSHLFHQWAKKQAFQTPRRLIDKVGFVIDERLRSKASKNKDLLRSLKASLSDDECFKYAEYVLRWEQIPLEKRTNLMRQKQDHFQKQRIENSMSSSEATSKQISYLQSLGCTIVPTSRLHASRLIEQYKSL